MMKQVLICALLLSLMACTTGKTIIPAATGRAIVPETGKAIPTNVRSELLQGERYFHDGYYKRAMRIFLPLACNGNEQAQYAVGYMYYYGLGVAQDTDVGYFWIQRSANQHYYPAIHALCLIQNGISAEPKCLSKSGIT